MSKIENEIKYIRTNADINESYLVGLMWASPMENFPLYGSKLKSKDFLHKSWGFYFGLGNALYKKGLKQFDDISVNATVEELGVRELFDTYGGLETIYELTEIVKHNPLNIESYFDMALKNKVIMSIMELVGNAVIVDDGNYKYREMNARQIATYWQDKMNSISVDSVTNYDSENLYITGQEFLDNLEAGEDEMLPYFGSKLLNRTVQGMPRGEVSVLMGFGNSGKSSFMVDKILMSCLFDVDKTLVILNEEGADKLREKVFLSIASHEMRNESFPRWKLNNVSEMNADERDFVIRTFDRWSELTEGDEAHIKIVYMEQYTIEDLRNIVALHANRGYVNLIIDTHKVPDQYKASSRWEAFVEATKEIYKFTREEGGGFNLRTILTAQLADSHINDRFLGFDAIGEGKAMKNEVSVLLMYRPLFGDEYDKLKVRRFVPDPLNKNKYTSKIIDLDKTKTYYVMFTPKNRFGANTDSGGECIVYEVNFDFNSFKEIGQTKIERNYM